MEGGSPIPVLTLPVAPVEARGGQGTGPLRWRTAELERLPLGTESAAQVALSPGAGLRAARPGCALVLGADGRRHSPAATRAFVQTAAANGVARVVVGQHGLLSTPAASHLVRQLKAVAGVVLTAGGLPGGPDGFFGINFIVANGGPAPLDVRERMQQVSRLLREISICPELEVDLTSLGLQEFDLENKFKPFCVEVVHSVDAYADLLSSTFDFAAIRDFLSGPEQLSIHVDAMHGVMGPYVRRVVCEALGAPANSAINCVPLEDFGGQQPEPSLAHARDLVEAMRGGEHGLGAALSADGSRCLILGRGGFYVSPSDSLAVIADNAACVASLRVAGLRGLARSVCTSAALDRVAKAAKVPLYETPGGWEFFASLMDANRVSVCGDENFSCGSEHGREADGLWTLLAWLSVLAARRCSVESVVREHWAKFGRNFYRRFDYEDVDAETASRLVQDLRSVLLGRAFRGQKFSVGGGGGDDAPLCVARADDFEYTDPVDGNVTRNQALRIIFTNGSRIIFRLSGTGGASDTFHIYLDCPVKDPARMDDDPQAVLAPLAAIALKLSGIHARTGRAGPSVIT